jgi:DNA-binding NarL/FixJ family response regulator
MVDSAETPPPSQLDTLTRREREVLELAARGIENKVIATELSISQDTVKSHLKKVYRKLHVRNRTEAALVLGSIS